MKLLRRTVLVLPALLVALGTAAGPAAADPVWAPLAADWGAGATRVLVSDVWSTGHEAWAVADESAGGAGVPVVQDCAGATCTRTALPVDPGAEASVVSVSGTSATDVWAVGDDSDADGYRPAAWHFDGHAWTAVATGLDDHAILVDVVTPSAGESWALGENSSAAGLNTTVYHRVGSTWTPVGRPTAPAFPGPCAAWATNRFADLTVVAGALVLVGACGNDHVVLKQDGASWRLLDDGPLADTAWGNAATISDQLWVTGTSHGKVRILRRASGVWTKVPTKGLPARAALTDLGGTTTAATWLVGSGRGSAQTWRFTGSSWQAVALPSPDTFLYAVAVSGTGAAYTVGLDPSDPSPATATILRAS